MHVAVCDDNVADRRHIERLLSRESDKRAGTPNILYIDSYGDKDHFLINPLKYNIIFMDMCSRPGLVEEIIEQLTMMGYRAPLILYSSKIDYTAIPNLPDYVIHAKKPYIPDPLPEYLLLGDRNVVGNIVTVSVHTNDTVSYIPKNYIMYALQEEKGSTLYLPNGEFVSVEEDISELRRIFAPYEEFERVNTTSIANFKFVSAVVPLSIYMQDYRKLKISMWKYSDYKRLKEKMDKSD